jgi:hypothetical protein
MPAARLALVSVVLLATLVSSAGAMQSATPAAPKGLHGFLLRPNEPETHVFSRTPAFAWAPARGAACYEFELATSQSFGESSVVWSNVSTDKHSGKHCRPVKARFPRANAPAEEAGGEEGEGGAEEDVVKETIQPIRIPAVSINLVLPWFTGKPYAVYAHVRSVTTQGASRWSKPFGFNMRWEDTPVPLPARPGLVRWTPVEGATGYEVWYGAPGKLINKVAQTHTNVADQRDLYTFHLEEGWWRTVEWRVRAVRQVVGAAPNGLPAVSYGPWTGTYTASNPAWQSGPLRVVSALSDEISSSSVSPHELMPALSFTGDQALDGTTFRLFRTYVFTDNDCVNVVFKGSVVGSPAFAPRINGPLKLPADADSFDKALFGVLPNFNTENAKTFTADTFPLVSNESFEDDRTLLRVDLPDLDVRTTRYFWTVVPVFIYVTEDGAFQYWDYESPQDACQAGRMGTFGKESKPAETSGGAPFVSGLAPNGRFLAQAGATPVVYSSPLIAWRPVVGATQYEVQWSRVKYPWRKRGSRKTHATTAILKLPAGLWYYRVRGLNAAQVGTPAMSWSAPIAVKVARPTFKITG